MEQAIPVFGIRNHSLPQKTRACAYVVIVNTEGLIAAVQENPGKLYLPGGGVELAETVRLTARIGQALQYLETDGHCQATYATFFTAELGDVVRTSHEHALQWAAPGDLYHACQLWAAQNCLARTADTPMHN